jgi:succinyl-diaminopimelate desuccinylase
VNLPLDGDVVDLARAIIDVPSESGQEHDLADLVERALRAQPHLEILRSGDSVLARTSLGRPERVLFGGHLDTVPAAAGDLPSQRDGDTVRGTGASDMKSGLAVMLKLAVVAGRAGIDTTYVFYECEEVAAERNGLNRIEREHSDWLRADCAVLMEPTSNAVEAGCQGTLRATITVPGVRAHSARAWLGVNAITEAAPVLERLRSYVPRRVLIDGCEFVEGLQVVRIEGGVSGNVVPDSCTITVNHRFAPDRSAEQALEHVRAVLSPFEPAVQDLSPGALPGLQAPFFGRLIAATGLAPTAKLGWTDVSRFAARGVPALNYGPGDALLAHTAGEWVSARRIQESLDVLSALLA